MSTGDVAFLGVIAGAGFVMLVAAISTWLSKRDSVETDDDGDPYTNYAGWVHGSVRVAAQQAQEVHSSHDAVAGTSLDVEEEAQAAYGSGLSVESRAYLKGFNDGVKIGLRSWKP